MNGIGLGVYWVLSTVRVTLQSDPLLPYIYLMEVSVLVYLLGVSRVLLYRTCIHSLMCFICPAVYLIWCQLLRMVSYSWVHAVLVVNGCRRRTRCSDFLSILSAMEASGSILSSMCVDVCRKCLGLLEEVTRDQMTVVFYVAVDVSSEWRNSVSVNASNSVRYSRVCYYMCGYYKWVLDRI